MKLWEILKEDNIGKIYIDSESRRYTICSNFYNKPIIIEEGDTDAKIFTQNGIMTLEFEEIKKMTGWERQKIGEQYYYIGSKNKVIVAETEEKCNFDNSLYNSCNYFSTKEKAEEVNKDQLLYRMMKKFYDEHDGNVDLNDSKYKYYICYNKRSQGFEIDTDCDYGCIDLHSIYFSTYQLATRCFEEIVKPFYNKYYGIKSNR